MIRLGVCEVARMWLIHIAGIILSFPQTVSQYVARALKTLDTVTQ